MDFFNRVLNWQAPAPPPPEELSADKIDMGYRLFWTKQALTWDAEQQRAIAVEVAQAVAAPDFEANALERRFRVAGLDDQAHSGASLLALIEVLRALAVYEDE